MLSNKNFQKRIQQELRHALDREGLMRPLSLADKLKREGFEEGFLEGRLEELIELWHDDRISQMEFQHKAVCLHNMLTVLENDPRRFSWLHRNNKTHNGLHERDEPNTAG